ncbi:hypothetical protein E5K00_12295 [Hymenobacter aquaticus]|uniref:Virginiamycin B lyase n=1 Tax=Hymenobacter aquaticus TaxID=1867101 RepID=A0A4Z0QB65_9BACT|nr:hypothetical protein [Hymenobacter aquaticus]TGE25932.1 hypothetical protein E5K00_12295 [Hymenobacter aquaticus]
MSDETLPVAAESPCSSLITEFDPYWQGPNTSSTHELAITKDFVFVSGQLMDQVAKFDHAGQLLGHFNMPAGSGPHGLLIDQEDQLWVSLEFDGRIVRLNDNGDITDSIDVTINSAGGRINPAPHGICQHPDGNIWFTGKRTSTIGYAVPGQYTEHIQLNTLAALPIFLSPGPDGCIWGTELLGSAILRISPNRADRVREFKTPTPNSRPIGIIPDPLLPCMWFSEEAGRKIGRINMEGRIQEFTLPLLQPNYILGSLTFDREMNLWVQVYVDTSVPGLPGPDYLLCIDKAIRTSHDPYLFGVPLTTHRLPSSRTMLHRIKTDPAGNLWFTEMMTDKLGKVTLAPG